MKTLILFLLFLASCSYETTRKVIPERNIAKADSFIIRQMNTIKITERYEDEDYDAFLCQAQWNALELYGIDTLGINSNQGAFVPFAYCTPEEKESLRKRMEK